MQVIRRPSKYSQEFRERAVRLVLEQRDEYPSEFETIRSVAAKLDEQRYSRLSGVSQSTVSRVLSGHLNVSAKTRAAVTEVLNRTGFVPNGSARAMRTQRSRSIGVVLATPVNLYSLEVMGAVHEHVASPACA